MNRRFLSAALLGAALQLTASLSLAMDLVVCSKGSDHVAIESGLMNDECCGETAAPAIAAEGLSGDGHCIDTPVVQGGVESSSTREALLASAHAPLVAVPMPVASAPRLPWMRTAHRPPVRGPSQDLRSRLNIVLLV